ncbi:MAG: oligoendopeptidase F [Planctomycetota bacterium]|nr:MAG: oligoendopeptidase F [Planctomycetota bacterium]
MEERRRLARLGLPTEQEALANELDVDGLQGWGRLYDRISSELRIPVMEHGEIVQKSPGQVTWDGPERTVRENNFRAADRAWRSIADTCADALNHIAGSRLTRYGRLPVHDHLDLPLALARMSRETLQTMWDTIAAQKTFLLPYLEAKARWLGVPRLAWFDLSAPIPAGDPRQRQDRVPYEQACRIIIDTFSLFSEELGTFAERALREGWVEAENRPGKRQGGFCAGFPMHRQSRIFMTYTDSLESLSVLAHELGHAYHGHVLRDLPVFLQQYPMNLAETASTFAEAVVGDVLLQQTTDPARRLQWLDKRLADAVSFLMNIHCRFLFEDEFYRRRRERELTAAELDDLMLAAQKTAYCNALCEDGWNPRFWASKLHFYITEIPFYNFPYTFGFLLSCGLCQIARRSPEGFAEAYRAFLCRTGRAMTEQVVKESFGYDLREPHFWNLALDRIRPWVDEFLQLSGGGPAPTYGSSDDSRKPPGTGAGAGAEADGTSPK